MSEHRAIHHVLVDELLKVSLAGSRNDHDEAERQLYDVLRSRAQQLCNRANCPSLTSGPTGLLHEALFNFLVSRKDLATPDAYLRCIVTAMQRLLTNRAIKKKRLKHGGESKRVGLDEADSGGPDKVAAPTDVVLAVDHALTELAGLDDNLATIVRLRFFGSLTLEEISTALDIPLRTVERKWQEAKTWLQSRSDLSGDDGPPPQAS